MKFNPTTVFLVLFGVFMVSCLACNMSTRFKEAMTEEEEAEAEAEAEKDAAKKFKKKTRRPRANIARTAEC